MSSAAITPGGPGRSPAPRASRADAAQDQSRFSVPPSFTERRPLPAAILLLVTLVAIGVAVGGVVASLTLALGNALGAG